MRDLSAGLSEHSKGAMSSKSSLELLQVARSSSVGFVAGTGKDDWSCCMTGRMLNDSRPCDA